MSPRRWVLAGVSVVVVGALAASGAALLRDDDPAAEPSRIDRYVALGDSYTAAPLVPDPLTSGACLRSSGNYPTLVAAELDIADFVDRSCSSATTLDMLRPQHPGVPPQLRAVTSRTDLVTVGIGANDYSLIAKLLLRCPQVRDRAPDGAPCRDSGTAAGRTSMLATIERTRERLDRLYAEIRRRAPGARVLAIGYPHVVDPGTSCPDRLPLADGDVDHLDAMLERLDEAIREAAEDADIGYVDVRRATRGHGICSNDPWINDDTTEQDRALFFHPFAEEQQAVADLVLDKLR